jgi:hypothetical protein
MTTVALQSIAAAAGERSASQPVAEHGLLLGNFPQAYSLLELITAAWELGRAREASA